MLADFLIALSLAMDAFAVSITTGLTARDFGVKKAALMGFYFGAFQFIMPLVGWFLGSAVGGYVGRVGPSIAFALLVFIGGRMIREAARGGGEGGAGGGPLTHGRLFVLAVATSVDALAVGVGKALLGEAILRPAVIIGAVAFALSFLGGTLGGRLGGAFRRRAGYAGGAVLVAIGLKILIENYAL